MIERMPQAEAARIRQRVWLTGGILLILWVVIGLALHSASLGSQATSWLLMILFAVALTLFALGWRGAGSVTALRPLGTTALILLGLWMPLVTVFWAVIPPITEPKTCSVTLGTTLEVMRLGLAIVTAIQILRAGVVPKPWAWAPLVTLAVVVLAQVSMMAFAVSPREQTELFTAMGLVSVAQSIAVVGLGVVAVILAMRPAARPPVEVFSGR